MRWTLATRLAAGFGLMLALSVGLALYQLHLFRETVRYVQVVAERDAVAYNKLGEIANQRMRLRAARDAAVLAAALANAGRGGAVVDENAVRDYRASVDRALAEIEELESFGATLDAITPERRAVWRQIARVAADMARVEAEVRDNTEPLFALLRQGRVAEVAPLLEASAPLHRRLDADVGRLAQLMQSLNRISARDSAAAYGKAQTSVAVASVIVLTIAILAAWAISRSITQPLARFIGFTRAVGEGDLSARLPEGGQDELADLGRHLNHMTASLAAIARDTSKGAGSVNGSVNQIRSSTQEQAAAMAEQLSAIEETSATLTQITQSGGQIARRAQDVEKGAQAAAAASQTGLKAVEDAVHAMDAIREQVETVAETIVSLSERTQAIGEIVLTVNTIAERSHLLALNAAIEAAAAGEHGRTFSVVAAEIKKLADQARDATAQVRTNLGEIQQGINSSVLLTEEAAKRVNSGKAQSEATDRIIRELAESIQDSVQAFQQIVAASNQHQIGLEQAMQALRSIRQASTETAEATRQLDAAAVELSRMSEGLLASAENYRI